MNQPIDDEGMVHFTTTLFALIRENLSIKMRAAEEMDQVNTKFRTLNPFSVAHQPGRPD
jgi:hypothetical protein